MTSARYAGAMDCDGRRRDSFESWVTTLTLRALPWLTPIWVRCQLHPIWGRRGWRRWPGELLGTSRTWVWVAVMCDMRPSAWEVLTCGQEPRPLPRPLAVDVRRVPAEKVEVGRMKGPRLAELLAAGGVRFVDRCRPASTTPHAVIAREFVTLLQAEGAS